MRHFFVAATLAAALPFAGLPSQFEKIAPAAKGRVGVAAHLLESGETASLHGDEGFRWGLIFRAVPRNQRAEWKRYDQRNESITPGDYPGLCGSIVYHASSNCSFPSAAIGPLWEIDFAPLKRQKGVRAYY